MEPPSHHNHLWPLFCDHLGEQVPEENFWTLWCKGRLTEADILTIWLRAIQSGLTTTHLHHPPFFTGRKPCLPCNQQCQSKGQWKQPVYRSDVFPVIQTPVSKHWNEYFVLYKEIHLLSALWHCWLVVRKSMQPVKLSDEVLAWLSVCSEVQMICIWSSWCHCHPIISCFVKIQNGLPIWCHLTQVVLEREAPLHAIFLVTCSELSANM